MKEDNKIYLLLATNLTIGLFTVIFIFVEKVIGV